MKSLEATLREFNVNWDLIRVIRGVSLAATTIYERLSYLDRDVVYNARVADDMDRYTNERIFDALRWPSLSVASLISEESTLPYQITPNGKFHVFIDPLDGSDNIKCHGPTGTIFSIYGKKEGELRGIDQLAAGYFLYSNSLIFVLTTGDGTRMFEYHKEYENAPGEFELISDRLIIPHSGKTYSVNEGSFSQFSDNVKSYVTQMKAGKWGQTSLRYMGSFVSDFHRILLRGGIFIYPSTGKDENGKLRLMYEANPMAFLIEQAGGHAIDEQANPILFKTHDDVHQRTTILIGSPDNIENFCSS